MSSTQSQSRPTRATWKAHGNPQRFIFAGQGDTPDKTRLVVTAKPVTKTLIGLFTENGKELVRVGNGRTFWAAKLPADRPATEEASEREVANGPHHLVIENDQARHSSDGDAIAVVTTYSRTFKSQASAEKAATSLRQTNHRVTVVAGRAPVTSLPGKTPGQVPSPATSRAQEASGAATSHTKTVRKAASKLHPCRCGCERQVANLFAQGHDARFVSQLAASYREAMAGKGSEASVRTARKQLLAEVSFSEPLTRKLTRSLDLIDEKAAKSSQPKQSTKAS